MNSEGAFFCHFLIAHGYHQLFPY